MFTLTTDRADQRLHIHMSGFLSLAEVDDIQRQIQSLVRKMGWHVSGFDALVTTSHDFVQSPEVVEALRQSVSRARYKARRTAVVRASMLAQMQTKRIVEHDRSRIFAGVEEAKAWLLEAPRDALAAESQV
jgi:hypothetical protein